MTPYERLNTQLRLEVALHAAEKRGRLMKRRLKPCTGVTADWCHNHGRCSCPGEVGDWGRSLDHTGCSLHAPQSDHPHGARRPR